MGIQLDWEIETDDRHLKDVGEDPDSARKRRTARIRLLVTALAVITLVSCGVAFARYRIYQVEFQVEQSLRDTVAAEVTSIRLNDWVTFASIQRSATGQWLDDQRVQFDEYQQVMQEKEDVRLTGHIVDLKIDDPRARVHVQEIVDGVPYTRIWFYWRYEDDQDEMTADGWRHVPPDPTFWGEVATVEGEAVTVNYHDVDAELAAQMEVDLDAWIASACAALICADLPPVRIEITSENSVLGWAREDAWLLRLPSPYLVRARSDRPFAPELHIAVASLLAERLVSYTSQNIQPSYPNDSYYIHQAVISWLAGRFIMVDTQSHLINSLATHYGESAVGQLLQLTPSDGHIGVLKQVIGVPLDQASLDWRDFFTWRLQLENDLIAQQDVMTMLSLYDSSNGDILSAAYARLEQPPLESIQAIVVRPHNLSADGAPQVAVTAQFDDGNGVTEMQILFRLVDNQWLRAS